MSLFSKEPKQLEPQEEEVETEALEPQEEEEVETEALEPQEEPRIKIDEESARIQFKILIRDLFDMEQQLKGAKKNYTEINERKRDKTCTEMELINRAETIKLQIKPLIDAFVSIGYTKEQIENMKREALEGIKHYIFYTL